DDAVMVVAAAGSGKTSTMVAKTGYVLHEGLATPEQILLLAFNRATADEVGQRIAEQLKGVPQVDKVRSNTFHAFGGSPPFSRTLTIRPIEALRSVHVEAKEVQHGVQAWCG